MRTIETSGMVDEQGNLVITVPTNMSQGEHHVVIMIDVPEEQVEETEEGPKEETEKLETWPPPGFNLFRFDVSGPTPSLRRKDLYDTDRG